MTFKEIEELIEKSKAPLPNEPHLNEINAGGLEGFQTYFAFLYNLTKYLDADVCMEIGIYNGIGTKHMAKACNKVTIGIDIQYTTEYNRAISILGDSTDQDIYDSVCELVDKYGKIKVLYQDSSHNYLPSVKEWELYSNLMEEGGVWICDDITPAFYDPNKDPEGCGMVQYFEGIPMKNKKLYPDVLHKGTTQGVILF